MVRSVHVPAGELVRHRSPQRSRTCRRHRADGFLCCAGPLLWVALSWLPVPTLAHAPQLNPALQAESEVSALHCELEQGGHRDTVDVHPVADPYGVASQDVGRFGFKAVWVTGSGLPDYLKIYTYADAVLLHQAHFAAQAGDAGLWDTGQQRIYAPGLGRQLSYRCRGSGRLGPEQGASPGSPRALPQHAPLGARGPLVMGMAVESATSSEPVARRPPPAAPGSMPEPEPLRVARVALVGDVLLDDGPGRLIRQGRDPFSPFAAWLDRADLRVGNLECVVARGGRADPAKPFSFRAHPRVLPVLARHVDAVGLANNHSGDYGPQAFSEMLDRLRRQGVVYFGGGRNLEQAHEPLIVVRKGVRIALLGYNEFMPRRFEADVGRPGIAWSEDEQVWLDIRRARSQADVVIPVMHWGQEHEPMANERQRELARWMIDAGADAVVGGHPHVTQDVEIYRGRPIVYSLGNFLFDGFKDADNNTAWLLNLDLYRFGVRSLHVVVGHIDREGTPHPEPGLEAPCWARGQLQVGSCRAVEL